MDIHFLGVGEACDGNQPNTSMLLKTDVAQTAGNILLDCGFSVPHRYLALHPPADELDVLWISHFHGDHFLGTPLLLLWFWEMGRQKPLYILGPPGVEDKINRAFELAYPNLLVRLGYTLEFLEVNPGEKIQAAEAVWQGAYNEHSQACLSLQLNFQEKTLFYSGDGRPTLESQALAQGCDIVIHEAYGIEDSTPGHGSIKSCLKFASQAGAKRLALVHVQRSIRPQAMKVIQLENKNHPELDVLLPETGNTISL